MGARVSMRTGAQANFLVGHDDYSKVVHHYRYKGVLVAYYGYVADAAESRPVVALVKRYYVLGQAGSGARACSLMTPQVARAVPVNFGGRFGASYLRGAATCATVVSRMFAHRWRELGAPFEVATVLIDGDEAFALLDSAEMRPSFIALVNQHGRWRIGAPIAAHIL